MGNCHRARPNEVLVVSGGCNCGRANHKFKTVVGGRTWAWSYFTKVQRLSTEKFTLSIKCDPAWTADGQKITVTGSVELQVSSEKPDDILLNACKLFLGKNKKEIEDILLHVVEGTIKEQVGSLELGDIFQDQNMVTQLFRDHILVRMNVMGITLMNNLELYLESSGKTQTVIYKGTLEELRVSDLRD